MVSASGDAELRIQRFKANAFQAYADWTTVFVGAQVGGTTQGTAMNFELEHADHPGRYFWARSPVIWPAVPRQPVSRFCTPFNTSDTAWRLI